jgi:hypothetical protein
MHLADFIESHLDLLVADWIEFARRLTDDSQDLSDEELKDLAAQLMLAIAADLRTPHINVGRIAALHAGRFAGPATISRVARGHAEERHRHGFTLDQMVAEFRALRVSVTRRWTVHADREDLVSTMDELVRFNEALDQTLTESIAHYTTQLTRARDMFAGVIAHDLRSPVQAIAMSAPGAATGAHESGHDAQAARSHRGRMYKAAPADQRRARFRAHATGRYPADESPACQSSRDRAARH